MYTGTIIEYIDYSDISNIETEVGSTEPFFIAAFSSEKGPEKPVVVSGEEFYKLFATPDVTRSSGYFIPFAKHGQPLLQAANIIDNGGKIYAKRVVASDATLANAIIYGGVTKVVKQKTVNNATVNYNVAQIEYSSVSIEGKKTYSEVVNADTIKPYSVLKYTAPEDGLEAGTYYFKFDGKYYDFTTTALTSGKTITWKSGDEEVNLNNETYIPVDDSETAPTSGTELAVTETKFFPILAITDNGRGKSKKKYRLIPNYDYSRDQEFMIYNLQIIEGDSVLVNPLVTLDHEKLFLNENISIDNQFKSVLAQVDTKFYENHFDNFISAISEITEEEADVIKAYDVINGTTRKGVALANIDVVNNHIAYEGFNLQNAFGNDLNKGSNGLFGDYPLTTTEYATRLVDFFEGKDSNNIYDANEIYDTDNYKFDVIFDANYPDKVKRAIENLVMFREDIFFFCDFGTHVKNYANIKEIVNHFGDDEDDKYRIADSKFVAYYHNYWDMIDPYTNKPITVTIMYDLAAYCIEHFNGGRVRPYAGMLYGFTFPNAIEGTVNYIPKIIPGVNGDKENQRQQLNDLRVNYCVYYDGLLTLDSEYTSQDKLTQFSFINNVLATQEVVKAIRTFCPKNRYTFLGQESLTAYQEDVENSVLVNYRGNFETLEMVYLGDSNYEKNKIFYAGINVRFNDFIQTEIFKVYALQ